jgi:hypothetical protein
MDHSLIETVLTLPGAHRLPDRQEVCDAELCLFFQNTRDPSKHVCLAIPLDIGPGAANAYFSTLTNVVQNNRPTVDTVVPKKTKILMYPGADIRGRSKDNPRPTDLCDPVKRVITYYFCMTPANIASNDYSRLLSLAGSTRNGPPKPLADALITDLRKLATFIEGITLTEPKKKQGGVDTKALKCYRLDKDKDVVGSKVYVGDQKRPQRTLDQELAGDPVVEDPDITGNSIQPGDIEQIIGIVLGVTVGIIVCATVAFFLWKYTFTNYLYNQKLYRNPISAASLSVKLPSLPTLCPPVTK